MQRVLRPLLAGVLVACLFVGCSERRATEALPAAASAPDSAASAASAAAAAESDNALVAYLQDAEIQAETDAQRSELRRALNDLQALPAAELRMARYAGADGRASQRDIVQVLHAHVVPTAPRSLDMTRLLEDRESAAGRAALRDTLAQLDRPASK